MGSEPTNARSIAVLLGTALFAIPTLLIVWYAWDSSCNRGFEFGYYADFNRVRRTLASLEGVRIEDSWANLDVTLEEFGFTLKTAAGQTVRIDVGEHDPLRDLSAAALTGALKREIVRRCSLETNR